MKPIECKKCGPIREITEVCTGVTELADYYIPEDDDERQWIQEDGDMYPSYSKSRTHFICKSCGTKLVFKGYGVGDLENFLKGE